MSHGEGIIARFDCICRLRLTLRRGRRRCCWRWEAMPSRPRRRRPHPAFPQPAHSKTMRRSGTPAQGARSRMAATATVSSRHLLFQLMLHQAGQPPQTLRGDRLLVKTGTERRHHQRTSADVLFSVKRAITPGGCWATVAHRQYPPPSMWY